jgi:hypothetical protein
MAGVGGVVREVEGAKKISVLFMISGGQSYSYSVTKLHN